MSANNDFWREAIQSVTHIGNNATTTEAERKEQSDRAERERQRKREEKRDRERAAYGPGMRTQWTKWLFEWSGARCSWWYPKSSRMQTQVEMFAAIPATIHPQQQKQKASELAKLIDAQPRTCGTDTQFHRVHEFLVDLQVQDKP